MIAKTTTALLEGLIDSSNESAWRDFDARYRPVIVSFARRVGLGQEDAADVAQETLVRFVKTYREGGYDRSRGRLRSWIIGIAKHVIADLKQQRFKRNEQRGLSAIADLPDDEALSQLWNAECERAIMQEALGQIREETKMNARTIRAFELLVFEQMSPPEVGKSLEMSVNDVYLSKHRCLSQMRKNVEHLRALYEVYAE